MARFARVVVPGLAYHLTHRGNRGADVFFTPGDREVYQSWLGEYADAYGLEVWAYCLMTNHVHLLAVARERDSLAMAIGRTHMRFARWVNRRQGWRGHLWGNRFFSTPLDEPHLWQAVRYVELNPVRAGIVRRAEEYPWSSARAHCLGSADPLLSESRPFLGRVADWSAWLAQGLDLEAIAELRRNTSTGRPTGSPEFTARLEEQLGRMLRPRKNGRKRRKE